MDYRDSGSCLARRRPVGRRHDDLKALEGIGTMRDVFTAGGWAGGLASPWLGRPAGQNRQAVGFPDRCAQN